MFRCKRCTASASMPSLRDGPSRPATPGLATLLRGGSAAAWGDHGRQHHISALRRSWSCLRHVATDRGASSPVTPPQPGGPVAVTSLGAQLSPAGGKLLFADSLTHAGAPSFDVALPADGTPRTVWVGGAFPNASTRFGDVIVEVRAQPGGGILASHPTMVRVRKNANQLTPLRSAVASCARWRPSTARARGGSVTSAICTPSGAPDREAHGGPGFLPWHRIYLLDLERELQLIDPRGESALLALRSGRAERVHAAVHGCPECAGLRRVHSFQPLALLDRRDPARGPARAGRRA